MSESADMPSEKELLEYWKQIQAASMLYKDQMPLRVYAISGSFFFACLMVGALAYPGLGSVIGGAVGLIVGWYLATPPYRVFGVLLPKISDEDGIEIARSLIINYRTRLDSPLIGKLFQQTYFRSLVSKYSVT